MSAGAAEAIRAHLERRRDDMVDLLVSLASAESPTDVPQAQAEPQRILREALEPLGYRVRRVAGERTGGHLLAVPAARERGRPLQLLVGHSDTVWPLGTLSEMPVAVEDGRVRGPGTFDMKGGLTQMVFALDALRALGAEPPATPVAFVNSDEEVGSPESKRWVERLARSACRCFVLEPSYGPAGALKTARKGVATYTVTVRGKAAHAGLDPAGGVSAIEGLARVVRDLHALADLERGLSVNVGVVRGGTRPNVIAAEAVAEVDVRALTLDDSRRVDARIRAVETGLEGATVAVEGGLRSPPLERTARNRRLLARAQEAARRHGFELGEAMVGGGSDGNTTSVFAATLDGLGAVGDGAHARHEHLLVEHMVERTALLVELLLSPVDEP